MLNKPRYEHLMKCHMWRGVSLESHYFPFLEGKVPSVFKWHRKGFPL